MKKVREIIKKIIVILIAVIIWFIATFFLNEIYSKFDFFLIYILSRYLIPQFIAGLIAGYIIKEKGWLYGVIVGVFTIMIEEGISIGMILYPNTGSLKESVITHYTLIYDSLIGECQTLTQRLKWGFNVVICSVFFPVLSSIIGGHIGEIIRVKKLKK